MHGLPNLKMCSQGYGKRDTCILHVRCAASQYVFKLPEIDMVIVGKGMMSQRAKCYMLAVLSCKICAYIDWQCHSEHTMVMIYAWMNSPWLLSSKTQLRWIILKLVTMFTVFMKIKCLNMFCLPCINPLKTKCRLLYLKTQSVPHSKQFSSGL